ncbi:MAG: DUF1622 domain-containing protein [Dechloromonas sp.]|jgi:uncharacterized membrane protein|nr:DUF1622 domain-containing protein [Dechloromonas sp.]MBN8463028.1 DUF1622 domain-containing protein [Dechloromonas sp.]
MFETIVHLTTAALELAGIFVMTGGMLAASLVALARAARGMAGSHLYEWYRQTLARAILLGLEFLVAADIINTVAVDPSFRSVGVLALIVLVRTFLSFTLELDISGRWPWQAKPAPAAPAAATDAGRQPEARDRRC